jgi:HEAT repeat protein
MTGTRTRVLDSGCSTVALAAAALVWCAGTGGCASGGKARQAASASDAKPAPSAESGSSGAAGAMSNLELSELRELALARLARAGESPDAEERYNAIEATIPVPTRLETAVRRGLADRDDRVRIVAIMAAGRSGLCRVNDLIRPCLQDKSEMVQAAAIFALCRCGEAIDQQPLASLLQHPRPLFRAHAAYILGELGNPSALALLRDAAHDPLARADPAQTRVYRLQLAEAMVKLGENNALHEIRAALYPSQPGELEAAAFAAQVLGQVKDRASAAQLRYLTEVVDPQAGRMPAEIRLAAATALVRMGYGDDYTSNPTASIRAQSAILLGETRRRSNLPALREIMKSDSDVLVQVSAAAGILRITDGDPTDRSPRAAQAR